MPTRRELTATELERVVDIDVSEEGSLTFVQDGVHLTARPAAHRRPPRPWAEWEPKVRRWQAFVLDGGVAVGAFEADRLVGVAVLRRGLEPGVDELAALFVDRDWRRRGVATALVESVMTIARDGGARVLYVSSAESDSAVGFYLSQGFRPLAEPNAELWEREPLDIHMARDLGP